MVGTTSIEKNELISQLLRRRGIKHEILNAKNHEQEARIIAKAGEKYAVTVATNMAGRGVDILLGGDTPKHSDGKDKIGTSEWKEWEKKHKEVVSFGGLYVIGTERHESRRIDNQLRGRSGRQGDPGASRFFIGLDDEIMRIFGGGTIANLMTRLSMPEDIPLQHGIVSRAIEQAQGKVEGFNFDIRKHLVEYDDVLNKQREIIYTRRRKILEDKDTAILKKDIINKINAAIATLVQMQIGQAFEDGKSVDEKIIDNFTTIIPFDEESKKQLTQQLRSFVLGEKKIDFLSKVSKDIYEKREKEMDKDVMRQVERLVMLSTIDNLWIDHLDAVENLRQGIGLRGYGQREPLVEYKNEAFKMFEQLINGIDDEIVHRIYRIQVQPTPMSQHQHMVTQAAGATSIFPSLEARGVSSTINQRSGKKKLGRNDKCWCGSGKKYKKCHYQN